MQTGNYVQNENDKMHHVEIETEKERLKTNDICYPEKQGIKCFLDSLYLDLDNIILDANRNVAQNLNVDNILLLDKINKLNELIHTKNQQNQVKLYTSVYFCVQKNII